MADVVVFHSALGVRRAVRAFANDLRDDGHRVHVPDLYEGAVFDDVDAGVAERDRIGVPELLRRASDSITSLPAELVYAGFSFGALPAALLAATRTGAKGALLIQGGATLARIGVAQWPVDVPVQLHVGGQDPWFDEVDAAQVLAGVPTPLADLRQYPGEDHLFFDPGLDQHNPHATKTMMTAIRRWLEHR